MLDSGKNFKNRLKEAFYFGMYLSSRVVRINHNPLSPVESV